MKKCDFCQHSYLQNGKLACPLSYCILSKVDIDKILNAISKTQKQEKVQKAKNDDIFELFDYYL